jgi:uncharacterized protein (TIGR02246 family)
MALAAAGCMTRASGTADAADTRAVRQVIDQFYAAARQRQWDAAGTLMAPDFEIFTDGAERFSKDTYVALLKQDDLIVERMTLHDMKVRVAGDGRMAWASFRGVFGMTSRGARHDVETVETLILSRLDDRWQIVQAHASVKSSGSR